MFLLLVLSLSPLAFTSAHEVYVLDQETVSAALSAESPNPFGAYIGNEYAFYFWGFISFVVISTIFSATVFGFFERQLRPLLNFLKRFAHTIVRLTVSVTLIVFGWYGVLYGPELPFAENAGALTMPLQTLLIVFGLMIGVGFFTRVAALGALFIYIYALMTFGLYVFSYVNHLGAYIFLIVMGSGMSALDVRLGMRRRLLIATETFLEALRPYVFPMLRIGFGLAIMLAALYAKFWHSELAYQVVVQYELTRFFPFDPLFVVLGAFIIEFIAGFLMMIGVAVRWTALFLAFWLTMGHIFTVEAWWVHLILYGIALAIFCHGYDRWSLEGRFLRRNGREPVF